MQIGQTIRNIRLSKLCKDHYTLNIEEKRDRKTSIGISLHFTSKEILTIAKQMIKEGVIELKEAIE